MHWAFIRGALASTARLAIIPVQDVLGLGSDARMNTPSRSDGNWGWRLAPALLTQQLAAKLAAISELTDRVPVVSAADQQRYREMREDFAA